MRIPDKLSPAVAIGASLIALAIVAWIDYATAELSVMLLYFLPIGIAAWYGGRKLATVLAFLSTGSWLLSYVHAFIVRGWSSSVWETVISLGVFLAFGLAVAALRSARNQLRQTADELARSNRDLEEFAYTASHDLQEPLRMVEGFMQMLREQYAGKLDECANEYIDYAVDGATRMQELIRGLLAFSRVDRDARHDRCEEVDCQAVLRDVLDNLAAAVAESHAEVTHDALPKIIARPAMVAHLFQNLVGNAIKYRSAERTPKVHVSCRSRKGEWEFSVQDNGIGIAPSDAQRVFQMFQRLHTRSEYPGTGMGLAICRKIVDRHGGRIWVESQKGSGATFHFTLPREPKKS